MFCDEPSPRGSQLPDLKRETPPPLLLVAPDTKPFLPQATIISAPSESLPSTVTDLLATTAPIHKVSRGTPEPARDIKTEGCGVTQFETYPSSSTLSSSSSSSKISGVATIILPPHQNSISQDLRSSTALRSHFSRKTVSPPVISAPKPCYPLSSSPPASAASPLPGSILTSRAVSCDSTLGTEQTSPPRGTTVIDLNLCNTVPADVNNNDIIPLSKTKIYGAHHIVADTNLSTRRTNNINLVNSRASNLCINNNIASTLNTTGLQNREEAEKYNSVPLKSLEQFLSDQLPFDFGRDIDREDVFADPTDTENRHNCKCVSRQEIGSTLRTEADKSFNSSVQPPVLPSFSSFFNEQSSPSYLASISMYNSNAHYYHPIQFDNEEENMTMPGLPHSDNDIIVNTNPVFGLTRSDSGFCSDGAYTSRTNSSSSYCSTSSSSSSVDMDCDEHWGSDLAEERNYTDLTDVRSVCPGQEVLPSIMNEDDEEGSLHILFSGSETVKSEPLEEYGDFSMTAFISHLQNTGFDSDGYSSSTDNESPHYTQLDEASSLFSGSTIMGGFPTLPVLPNDQVKMPITSTVPSHLAQPSPSSDQSDSERWVVKENLPDFGKLQDPSAEEEERPTPSRRHSVSSSPKEKKKVARESPTLSEKSLSDRKKPGRKKGQVSNVLHLWEFMRDLLKDPRTRGDIIEWISEKDGVFRVVNSAEVAKLWGEKKKNKKEMTYEKMSRSLRYSRLEGYFSDLPKDKNYPKKLCFKFGPKSKDWY